MTSRRRPTGGSGSLTSALALRNTVDHLRTVLDAAELDRILGVLSPVEHELLASAADHDMVPYEVTLRLWRSADVLLGARDAEWMERMGAAAVARVDAQLGTDVVRRASPLALLTQQIPFFRLYYQPGDMVLLEHGSNDAIIRLVDFDPVDRRFCRRFTGGWTAAIAIAGGGHPVVRHLRCVCDGDMFCEWLARWEP